jgi:2-polyprenyl-3-methyl-5-hydroxy-6-metoxy-1,4-benzoquinol methylase
MAASPVNALDEPRADTAPSVHETVLRSLEGEKPGRILDAAAGEGALAKHLMQMGFNVEACDLNPTRYKLTAPKCRRVDLNQPLPYPSEYFDFVVCVEAIEHLHDPWLTIMELKRILKRNGKLVITTPNILSITSRLCFLLFGEYAYFRYGKRLWRVATDVYHELDKHISPLNFWQIEYALVKNNMRLESIKANRRTPRRLSSPTVHVATLILGPFIRAVTRWHFGDQDVSALLNSDVLFHGEILILKARSL